MSRTRTVFALSLSAMLFGLLLGVFGLLPSAVTFGLLLVGMFTATVALVTKINGVGQYDSASAETGRTPDSQDKKGDENVYEPLFLRK
jgi:hypothetical protein